MNVCGRRIFVHWFSSGARIDLVGRKGRYGMDLIAMVGGTHETAIVAHEQVNGND